MDAKAALKNKNAEIFSQLRKGEKILVRSVISPGIYWKSISILLVGLLFSFFLPILAFLMLVIAFGVFLYSYFQQSILSLIVTNRRIFLRMGTMKISTIQLKIELLHGVDVQKTLFGHVFGYSTVMIVGNGNQYALIPYVSNSAHIRNVLDEIIYQRDRKIQEDTTQA